MLKFLVDESTGRKLNEFLLNNGFDSKFVLDVLPGADDENILEFAEKESMILITNDKDFGELIFRLNRPSSGVIFLRLRIDTPRNRQLHVLALTKEFEDNLKSYFTVVTEGKTRRKRI